MPQGSVTLTCRPHRSVDLGSSPSPATNFMDCPNCLAGINPSTVLDRAPERVPMKHISSVPYRHRGCQHTAAKFKCPKCQAVFYFE